MNVNEECLLQFLNNPKRLEVTTKELKKLNFSLGGNIPDRENFKKRLELINIR